MNRACYSITCISREYVNHSFLLINIFYPSLDPSPTRRGKKKCSYSFLLVGGRLGWGFILLGFVKVLQFFLDIFYE